MELDLNEILDELTLEIANLKKALVVANLENRALLKQLEEIQNKESEKKDEK